MPIRTGSIREVINHDELKDMDGTVHDARYLKLDQTTEQDVDNGAPHFNGGIIIKSGQRLTFDG